VTQYRAWGERVQRQQAKEELPLSLPIIAAFCTAAGRVRMNYFRECTCRRNIYYQGVDSLIVNEEGYAHLCLTDCVRANELGYLRLIGKYDTCTIYGCADYVIGGKAVVAGRPSKAHRIAENEYVNRSLAVRDRVFHGAATDSVPAVEQLWSRHGTYGKGVVGEDGWVTPFHLSQTTGANA
jgi:hypothetical protein